VLYVGGPAEEPRRGGWLVRAAVGVVCVGAIAALLVAGGGRSIGALLGSKASFGQHQASCASAGQAIASRAVAAVPPASAGRVSFSGTVSAGSSGQPLPAAMVFLNGQAIHADQEGHWAAHVDAASMVDVWIVAPGFSAYHGQTTLSSADGPVLVQPIDVALRSIFDTQDDFQGYPGHVPPQVTAFSAGSGPAFSQVLPATAQELTICGTLGTRDGRPALDAKAWLALPDDSVQQTEISTSSGSFRVTLPLSGGPGAYLVELNDRSGSSVLKVPLFVGTPYAFQPPPRFPDNLTGSESLAQGLTNLNQRRTAHGLAPLGLDPRLAALAQAHIEDWAGSSGLDCPHCWSDGAQLADHARAMGVPVAKRPVPLSFGQFTYEVAEGITRGVPGGAASIQALFDSPAHRADLLGDYTHVGMADSGQGSTRAFVVEYAKED
jgi:uncharacterized protein YkwD